MIKLVALIKDNSVDLMFLHIDPDYTSIKSEMYNFKIINKKGNVEEGVGIFDKQGNEYDAGVDKDGDVYYNIDPGYDDITDASHPIYFKTEFQEWLIKNMPQNINKIKDCITPETFFSEAMGFFSMNESKSSIEDIFATIQTLKPGSSKWQQMYKELGTLLVKLIFQNPNDTIIDQINEYINKYEDLVEVSDDVKVWRETVKRNVEKQEQHRKDPTKQIYVTLNIDKSKNFYHEPYMDLPITTQDRQSTIAKDNNTLIIDCRQCDLLLILKIIEQYTDYKIDTNQSKYLYVDTPPDKNIIMINTKYQYVYTLFLSDDILKKCQEHNRKIVDGKYIESEEDLSDILEGDAMGFFNMNEKMVTKFK